MNTAATNINHPKNISAFRTIVSLSLIGIFSLLFLPGCKDNSSTKNNTVNEKSTGENDCSLNIVPADKNGLKLLFTELQEAIWSDDTETALVITKSLFPDETSLRKVVKDPEAIKNVKEMHSKFCNEPDQKLAGLFRADPENTEILVFPATTEEIAGEIGRGSKFPGGAVNLAKTVLQPNVTFYEVKLVKPGETLGMAYHLFYHDGKNWKMLGPAWRVLH